LQQRKQREYSKEVYKKLRANFIETNEKLIKTGKLSNRSTY